MAVNLPRRRSGEPLRFYFRRLSNLRTAIRAYLPELRDSAVQAGRDAGLTVEEIARRMGTSVAWLYTNRAVASDYDAALLPKQRRHEDTLAYYTRLRELRNALRDELPTLVVPAVAEAEQEAPRPTKTQVAADMGITESQLFKQLRQARKPD